MIKEYRNWKNYFGNFIIVKGKKMKSKEDFWSEVREMANTRSLNETERRNMLMALDLLWKSGYYSRES